MYTMDELNDKLLSELKNITEELGIKGASKLSKQDLIYKILDEQAISKPKNLLPKKTSLNLNLLQRQNLMNHLEDQTQEIVLEQMIGLIIGKGLLKIQSMKNK